MAWSDNKEYEEAELFDTLFTSLVRFFDKLMSEAKIQNKIWQLFTFPGPIIRVWQQASVVLPWLTSEVLNYSGSQMKNRILNDCS